MTANNIATTQSAPQGLSPVKAIELILLIALLAGGFALRAWDVGSVDVDHFDEGVYVFSALGLTDPAQPYRLYPEQLRFSPPVYFGLVGLSYLIAGGPSDTAAIMVNVLLGTGTIAAIWWVGRRWFGRPAGVAAATLLAFNEYHIALSRTALTDVAYALVFLLALGAIVHALQRQHVGWALVAGLLVGLAWNTKYHGWFALVAGGGALLPWLWLRYRRGQPWLRPALVFGVIGVVAVLCYLPWALYVQSQPGGYVALAQYQRTLLSRAWPANLWRQMQQQLFFEGVFSRASVLLAVASAGLVAGTRLYRKRWLLWLILLGAASLLLGGAGTAALLALAAVPLLLIRRPGDYSSWLLPAWLGLWFVSTPLYHPYARLVLPFTIASFLGAGFSLRLLLKAEPSAGVTGDSQPPLAWAAVAGLAVVLLSLLIPDASNPWRQTYSVPQAAAAMEAIVPPDERVIVIGEPTLAYYLHLAGRPAFERLEDMSLLAAETEPVYVVTGIYTRRAPSLRQGLEDLRPRLEKLAQFEMVPDDIRLLDDFAPPAARSYIAAPDDSYTLTLYHLQPGRQ